MTTYQNTHVAEVTARCEAANRALGELQQWLRAPDLSQKSKMALFQAFVMSTSMYNVGSFPVITDVLYNKLKGCSNKIVQLVLAKRVDGMVIEFT